MIDPSTIPEATTFFGQAYANPMVMILLVTNFIGLVWFAFSTSNAAKVALQSGESANARITEIATHFADYRERIAKEYVSLDGMQKIEDRLSNAIKDFGTASAAAIDRLGQRLDRAFDNRPRPEP
jgi:hypothetical protein